MELPNIESYTPFLRTEDSKDESVYNIKGFDFERKSKKGADIPCMEVIRADDKIELALALFNLTNYKDFKEKWGANAEDWTGKSVRLLKAGQKFKMEEVN